MHLHLKGHCGHCDLATYRRLSACNLSPPPAPTPPSAMTGPLSSRSLVATGLPPVAGVTGAAALVVAVVLLLHAPSLTAASPHLPAFATMPDLRHTPTPHPDGTGSFTHSSLHEDVFGGTTALAYTAQLHDGIVVVDPLQGTLTCVGEDEMTLTSTNQTLLDAVVAGVVVVGAPEHGCYPDATGVGHPQGRSVHRGVGQVLPTDRNGAWGRERGVGRPGEAVGGNAYVWVCMLGADSAQHVLHLSRGVQQTLTTTPAPHRHHHAGTIRLLTTIDLNPLQLVRHAKLRFHHKPVHTTSRFNTHVSRRPSQDPTLLVEHSSTKEGKAVVAAPHHGFHLPLTI